MSSKGEVHSDNAPEGVKAQILGGAESSEDINDIDKVLQQRVAHDKPHVALSPLLVAELISAKTASGSTVRFIARAIPRDVVAKSLNVDASNISKLYKRAKLSQTQTEQLNGLTQIWDKALHELFDGDENLMERWLEAPVPALSGKPPRYFLDSFSGRKVLEGYVQALKYGDYS